MDDYAKRLAYGMDQGNYLHYDKISKNTSKSRRYPYPPEMLQQSCGTQPQLQAQLQSQSQPQLQLQSQLQPQLQLQSQLQPESQPQLQQQPQAQQQPEHLYKIEPYLQSYGSQPQQSSGVQ